MTERALAVKEKNGMGSLIESTTFQQLQEVAGYLAKSDLIPKHFQNKPANVFIALEYANRMNMSPFMVMQSLYVVYGRPGLEGKLITALVNNSGLFQEPLDFVFEGTGDEYGCYAQAKGKNGRYVKGPKVTWKMVKAEGWDAPKKRQDGQGTIPSKWTTMSDLMFRYRAASYFAKTVCPEVLMGMPTVEELEDVVDLPLADEPRLIQPDAAAIEEAFWKALEEINIAKDDPDLTLFLDETSQALGRPKVEVMQGALEEIANFFQAYQAWLAEKAQPEAEQNQEGAAPPEGEKPQETGRCKVHQFIKQEDGSFLCEVCGYTQKPKNEAPDPDAKICVNTMNAITAACKEKGVALAAVMAEHGEKGKLLKELTEAKGQEILAQLKG